MRSLPLKRNYHPFDGVDIIAQISDLKEVDYKNTLVISALVELLVEKGIVTRQEILQKANQLEVDMTLNLLCKSSPSSSDIN